MDYIRLWTTFYDDPELIAAGEAAEVLYVRAMAYAGRQETDGFIPKEMPARLTPAKTQPRITALVREGLWVQVEGGWRIVNWERRQTSKEELEASREGARRRQAAKRERDQQSHPKSHHPSRRESRVTDDVTHAGSSRTEVEVEVEDAAAAASRAPEGAMPPPLPPAVEILRARLEAAKMTVRWDRLTSDELAEVEALIAAHGDAALVKDAIRQYQPNRPIAFAQGWLAGWRQLRPPGRLALVVNRRCHDPVNHAHQPTTAAGDCVACISDSHSHSTSGRTTDEAPEALDQEDPVAAAKATARRSREAGA
jgi:hypothetical protein